MTSSLEISRTIRVGLNDQQHIAAIAAELVEEIGLEPPIPLDIVASCRGISRIERLETLDCPGCLIPIGGDWVIQLRAADGPGRQRFSGFHEVGHTFMPGFALGRHYRCHPRASPSTDSPSIESLCDTAAAELLFPETFFLTDLETSAFSLDASDDLAARYISSREAAARRLVQLWPERGFAMVLAVSNKLNEPQSAPPRLRLQASVPGGPGWREMWKLKSVADDDPLQAVLEDGEFAGITTLRGLQPAGRFDVHARLSQWPDPETGELQHRVFAIARPLSRTSYDLSKAPSFRR